MKLLRYHYVIFLKGKKAIIESPRGQFTCDDIHFIQKPTPDGPVQPDFGYFFEINDSLLPFLGHIMFRFQQLRRFDSDYITDSQLQSISTAKKTKQEPKVSISAISGSSDISNQSKSSKDEKKNSSAGLTATEQENPSGGFHLRWLKVYHCGVYPIIKQKVCERDLSREWICTKTL